MYILSISVLYMQGIRKLQYKLQYKLTAPCMHYLSKSKTSKQEKMAKFTNLSFCQKLFFCIKLLHANVHCVYIMQAKYQIASVKALVQKPLLRSKDFKKWLIQNAVILSKSIFMASNFFMQMFFMYRSTLCRQSIR